MADIRSPDILSAHPQEVISYSLSFPMICSGV